MVMTDKKNKNIEKSIWREKKKRNKDGKQSWVVQKGVCYDMQLLRQGSYSSEVEKLLIAAFTQHSLTDMKC